MRGVAGGGELRSARGGDTRSAGGGVILTLGEERVRLLLIPLRTELLLPPRLQETAESDLEGVVLGVRVPVELVEGRLPRAVPPLMTVVPPGVWGRGGMSSSNFVILGAPVVRQANFPPIAAVMGK